MTDVGHLAIIGDVHGDAGALRLALADLEGRPGHIILLGDYVNRGPDSKAVLELLLKIKTAQQDALILLLGNHELALLEFLGGGDSTGLVRHAGLSTIRSYLGPHPGADPFEEFKRTFPSEHLALLESMEPYYETEALLVSHAGFNPDHPRRREIQDVVCGYFPQLFDERTRMPKELVVCGHYIQRNASAYVSPGFICLDSGCGSRPGSPLSVLLLPERRINTYRGDT